MDPPAGIQKLDASILIEIFSYVRSAKSLAMCSQVCRGWHALTWSYALEMDLSSFQNGTNLITPVDDYKLTLLSALCPSIRKLNLRDCAKVTNVAVSRLSKLTNLQCLQLSGCRSLTDEIFPSLSNMAKLKDLDLTRLQGLNADGLKTLGSVSNLTRLILRAIDPVNDDVLLAISQLSQLKYLDVSACIGISGAGLKYLARKLRLSYLDVSMNSRLGDHKAWDILKNMVSLETLKLRSVVYTAEQMESFCNVLPLWTNLTDLRLGFCIIADSHAAEFAKLTKLRRLSIHNVSNLSPKAFANFSSIPILNFSRSVIPVEAIEHLQLASTLKIQNGKASSKRITISESSSRSSPNSLLSPSSSNSTSFTNGINSRSESSHINGKRKLETTIRSFTNIDKLCHLRILSLRIPNMENSDIECISRCKTLVELDLESLGATTCAGLYSLVNLQLLERLNLTNCARLNDDVLKGILPSLPLLKQLSLARCEQIEDTGLMCISANCLRLQVLILFQLNRITNEGIVTLVTLSDLYLLELSGCRSVDVDYCRKYLQPFLPVLHINYGNKQLQGSHSMIQECVIT